MPNNKINKEREMPIEWWAEQDLNLRPSACKANALPAEPSARADFYINHSRGFVNDGRMTYMP